METDCSMDFYKGLNVTLFVNKWISCHHCQSVNKHRNLQSLTLLSVPIFSNKLLLCEILTIVLIFFLITIKYTGSIITNLNHRFTIKYKQILCRGTVSYWKTMESYQFSLNSGETNSLVLRQARRWVPPASAVQKARNKVSTLDSLF